MNRPQVRTHALPWHRTRAWQRFLQDVLLVRGRRRYLLSISDQNPLGATDPKGRRVYINPFEIPDPGEPERQAIRWAPPNSPTIWQQAIATALVEHEAGHIRHSGDKPTAPLLGWVWNALEDERQERRQTQAHPNLAQTFDFLGDAVWWMQQPTNDLVGACLVWRWEWDRAMSQRRFQPLPEQTQVWEAHIRPLVEAAWQAPTSDDVTTSARQILHLLGLADDAPVPDDLPRQICRCGHGHGTHAGGVITSLPDLPPLPGSVSLPGHQAASLPSDAPPEQDPTAILVEVEGYARSLAHALRPPVPQQRAVPHPTRGRFVLERAMVRAPRPFDHRHAVAPSKDVAVLLLIDESGSMGDNWDSHSLMFGAIRATMLLERAAELADIPCGIWGFTDAAEPIVIRPLARGSQHQWKARIAGMQGFGDGTWLSDVFHTAVACLVHRQESLKLLIVLHDGAISADDAHRVQRDVAMLSKHGIVLQPMLLSTDQRVIDANTQVFGHVVACADISELAQRLSTWLRAMVAF